jgi:hypothetical protein
MVTGPHTRPPFLHGSRVLVGLFGCQHGGDGGYWGQDGEVGLC